MAIMPPDVGEELGLSMKLHFAPLAGNWQLFGVLQGRGLGCCCCCCCCCCMWGPQCLQKCLLCSKCRHSAYLPSLLPLPAFAFACSHEDSAQHGPQMPLGIQVYTVVAVLLNRARQVQRCNSNWQNLPKIQTTFVKDVIRMAWGWGGGLPPLPSAPQS